MNDLVLFCVVLWLVYIYIYVQCCGRKDEYLVVVMMNMCVLL